MAEIIKSDNHSKIAGDYGENLVVYWLSRSGWEAEIVRHTGIDIIASRTNQDGSKIRIGISVKTRTREDGTESDYVHILNQDKSDRGKLETACAVFGLEPWIAVYSEAKDHGDLYMTSLKHYFDSGYGNKGTKWSNWSMTKKAKEQYSTDREVHHIETNFRSDHWWSE